MARNAAIDALIPTSGVWADDFTARYELHREWLASERARRQARQQTRPEAQPFVERAREVAELVTQRFRDGFHWHGGCVAGQPRYYRSPFVYHGLVSKQHAILRLFVASTYRTAQLQTGHTKGAVTTGGPKVLALDEAYVATNADMRRVLRIELDSNWPSWEALEGAITRCGVQMPNIVIANAHEVTGAVQHPHLIWMLENAVCFTERGNARNIAAFRAVLRSLCFALSSIGADPGGLSNSLKTKNPLSPLWHTRICRETPFQSLSELREGLPWGITMAMLSEGRQDALSSPEARLGSNDFFSALRTWAFENVPQHHPDAQGQGTLAEFQHDLTMFAHTVAEQFKIRERVAMRTAAKVAAWTWRHFDGRKWAAKKKRGRDRHLTENLTTKAAQQIAGCRTASGRAEASFAALVLSYRQIVAQSGSKPSQRALQKATGLGIATVKRHWKRVVSQVSDGAIDKKAPADRRSEEPQLCSAVDTLAQANIIQIQNPTSTAEPYPPTESPQIDSSGNSHAGMTIHSSKPKTPAETELSAFECPW